MEKRCWLCAWIFFTVLFAGFQAFAEEAEPPFRVGRLLMATGIEAREPVGVDVVFPADTEKVFCFLEAFDIPENTHAEFVWIYEGVEMYRMDLPLGAGPRWRTRAEKRVYGFTGEWRVEIRDAFGMAVDAVTFRIG